MRRSEAAALKLVKQHTDVPVPPFTTQIFREERHRVCLSTDGLRRGHHSPVSLGADMTIVQNAGHVRQSGRLWPNCVKFRGRPSFFTFSNAALMALQAPTCS